MDFYLAAILQALCFTPMCLGIYITLKVFNFPDITTDGSYTLGAVVCALGISNSLPLIVIVPVILISGALAGIATALIHTKLKVNALLSGILVMTALYSVNLSLMGRSNIPLLNRPTFFSFSIIPDTELNIFLITILIISILIVGLNYLLKSDFGLAMRATGNNELMIRSLGVNTASIKIIGLAITNSLVAFSGALVAQFQGFTDINMGIGIVISGLGAVMIAETVIRLFRIESMVLNLCCIIIGVCLFQLVLAFTLSIGIDANLLKLLTSCFVLFIVALPNSKWFKFLNVK
ncbi:ABC transporter permease [Olivibacter domesticus]|uniref:Putative ABC transport system permease protein n=1 Tax=Olivibacter domesticus TaxID=407022 RepID=A0A1H7HLR0_OLID1|nr:ABC transporter permease [Olivibacter domesticus]SEK51201.1 putative ABC transport system permease protein [Olivibacter domesticus]